MSAPVRFVITPSGVQVHVDGINLIEGAARLEDCDPNFWANAREAAAGHRSPKVVLHPPDVYVVRLTERPANIRAALAQYAPVLPNRLVWSASRSEVDGAAAVTIARRDRIAAVTMQFVDQRLPLPHFVDADGHALGGTIAERGRNRVTLAIVLAALLSIPATVAAGSWYQRQAIAQPTATVPISSDGRAFAAAARHPTLARSLVDIGRALPAGVRLVSVARGADGRVSLVIDASDPDQLREQMRDVPVFAAFRDVAQEQTTDLAYRVTFIGPMR